MLRLFFSFLVGSGILAGNLFAQNSESNVKIEADKIYNDGNGLLKSGNNSAAIQKYRQAITLYKDDFKYHYQLGLALKNDRQLEQAIESFKYALALKADLAIANNALGGVYLYLRKYDEAIAAFTLALEKDKSLSQAKAGLAESYAGRGQELLNNGKFDQAVSLLVQASTQYTDNSKIYLVLASAYNKMDQPKDAIETALNAIKHKKKGSKGAEYFELGIAFKKLGIMDKAREAFNEAKKDANYARNAQYELDGLK